MSQLDFVVVSIGEVDEFVFYVFEVGVAVDCLGEVYS